MKTKVINIIGASTLALVGLVMLGCETQLPQAKDPTLLTKTEEKPWVVKHISLFKLGLAFDILDSSSTRDATGVVVSGTNIHVHQDILQVEKKSEKIKIDNFLADLAKKLTPKNCTYTIQTRNGLDNYKIHEITFGECKNIKDKNGKYVFISNSETPDKVVQIKKENKFDGPRCDSEKKKFRYESIQFM